MMKRRRSGEFVVIPAAQLAAMTTEEVYEALGLDMAEETSASLSITAPSRYSPTHAAIGLRARFPVLLGLVHAESLQDVLSLPAPAALRAAPEKRRLEASSVGALDLSEPLSERFKFNREFLKVVAHRPSVPSPGPVPVKPTRDGFSTPQNAVANNPLRKPRALRKRPFTVGDIVQAKELIYEWLPDGSPHLHARPTDIGHVMHVNAEGWPSVWFERSSTETLVDPEDLWHLGSSKTGK